MNYYTEFYEVSSHDIDSKNEARATSIMRYMQETANHNMRDCKPSYTDLLKIGRSFILSRMNVEIYFPLHQYDKIAVESWPTYSPNSVSFIRSYIISRGEEIIAKGTGIWALIDLATHRFYKGCEQDQSAYVYGDPIEETLKKRVANLKNVELHFVGTHEIKYSETDFNHHMNNTNYADMLVNFLPNVEKAEIKKMTFNFVSEAKLGEEIKVFISCGNKNEEETIYYFRTEKVDGKTNVEAEFAVKYN